MEEVAHGVLGLGYRGNEIILHNRLDLAVPARAVLSDLPTVLLHLSGASSVDPVELSIVVAKQVVVVVAPAAVCAVIARAAKLVLREKGVVGSTEDVVGVLALAVVASSSCRGARGNRNVPVLARLDAVLVLAPSTLARRTADAAKGAGDIRGDL